MFWHVKKYTIVDVKKTRVFQFIMNICVFAPDTLHSSRLGMRFKFHFRFLILHDGIFFFLTASSNNAVSVKF